MTRARRTLWLPGAERIPGPHAAGGTMVGGGGKFCTHHITVSPKGSYDSMCGFLVREGFEPTLIVDPTLGKIGQFIPANRSGYALEHPAGQPETNRAGDIHVQIEWVWPSMSEDITQAPHFDECWRRVVEFCDQLGVPRAWPCGFTGTSRSVTTWMKSGHRGHVNAPGNSHVDRLPAPKAPAWPKPAPKPALKPAPKPQPTPTPTPTPKAPNATQTHELSAFARRRLRRVARDLGRAKTPLAPRSALLVKSLERAARRALGDG